MKRILIEYDNYFDLIWDIRKSNKKFEQSTNPCATVNIGAIKVIDEEIYYTLSRLPSEEVFKYKGVKLPDSVLDKILNLNMFSNPNFMKYLNNEVDILEFSEEYLDKIIKLKVFE